MRKTENCQNTLKGGGSGEFKGMSPKLERKQFLASQGCGEALGAQEKSRKLEELETHSLTLGGKG